MINLKKMSLEEQLRRRERYVNVQKLEGNVSSQRSILSPRLRPPAGSKFRENQAIPASRQQGILAGNCHNYSILGSKARAAFLAQYLARRAIRAACAGLPIACCAGAQHRFRR